MINIQYTKDKAMLIFYRAVLIVVFALAVWGLVGVVNNYIIIPKNKRKIKENLSIYNGAIIKEIGFINKVSDASTFEYFFTVDGKTYSNKVVIGMSFKSNSAHYLMERSLPIAYEKDNPQNSRLLIIPEDFGYFRILFPDSLQWIKEDVLK